MSNVSVSVGKLLGGDRVTQVLAILAVSTTIAIGVHYGTVAVGTPDANCVVGQTRMLSDGYRTQPLRLTDGRFKFITPAMLVPSGFQLAFDDAGAAVPSCPAGLPLAMAATMRMGGEAAAFLVVPYLGALAVWATFVLARRLAGRWAGVAAAALLICSPLYLVGVIQPASDVPAMALWLASLAAGVSVSSSPDRRALGHAIRAGLLAGLAVMVRPHLFPLVVAPLSLVWLTLPVDRKAGAEGPSSRTRLVAASILGLFPGISAVGWLQAAIYGSPFASGTGTESTVAGVSSMMANLVSYPWWLAAIHTPVLLLAFAAPLLARGVTTGSWSTAPGLSGAAGQEPRDVRILSVLLAFALAVVLLELPGHPVSQWDHAGVVLPALPVLIILTLIAVSGLSRPLAPRWRATLAVVIVLGLGGSWIDGANARGVFRQKAVDRKYRELGRYAVNKLPSGTVVLANGPGGSISYYGAMPTIAWQLIPADRLDAVIDELSSLGYEPRIAIDASERDAFQARFGTHSALASLAWPPRATIGPDIAVYDPADRVRALAGGNIPTDHIVWPIR